MDQDANMPKCFNTNITLKTGLLVGMAATVLFSTISIFTNGGAGGIAGIFIFLLGAYGVYSEKPLFVKIYMAVSVLGIFLSTLLLILAVVALSSIQKQWEDVENQPFGNSTVGAYTGAKSSTVISSIYIIWIVLVVLSDLISSVLVYYSWKFVKYIEGRDADTIHAQNMAIEKNAANP
ncbi:hypothetical protein HDV03_003162 [Kappamyces sp. JEL0829]|nr:hypothetical protein HDV03_003162 [Kappamyces sp. JEL0829]